MTSHLLPSALPESPLAFAAGSLAVRRREETHRRGRRHLLHGLFLCRGWCLPIVLISVLLPGNGAVAVAADGGAIVALLAEDEKPKPAGKTAETPEKPAISLLDPKTFPKGWVYFSADTSSKLSDTWQVDDKTDAKLPVLICRGKPSGYLRTVEEYRNYELTLEWMYPDDPNCNSGILVHAGKDKIWPASIQIQLHRPFAGSIFPLKGATTTNRVTVKGLDLATGKWHTLRILSKEGSLTVWINDKKVGEVNGCQPQQGHIALQSEGSEIRFRRILLRVLPAEKSPPGKKPAAGSDGKKPPAKKTARKKTNRTGG